MTPFRDLPIRRKLLLMTLASSATALALAGVGFLAWDVAQYRSEIEVDVMTQARILSENSSAALAFDDARVAGETLAVLELRPQVRMACLYQAAGNLFATYYEAEPGRCPPAAPPETALGWDHFDVVTPVLADSDRVGTLFFRRDLDDLYARLRVGALTVVGLLLLAIGLAFVVANRLQRWIATPMLNLADTARRISSTREYSLRAIPSSRDEVGIVVHAFNDMLDHIGERAAELSRANTELEREVEERRKVERERTAALERERDANRLKDEFLATLSHELRTPLNAVLGWTRVLRTAATDPATSERALESIERNARAQARLIEDLLEVSRIVTGKLRLQIGEVDLAAIVDAAAEIVQPAALAKRQQLVVDVAVRPALTRGDADRLQQVIWNLLSNAVKFTPAGGTVTVRLVQESGFRITVQDTGPGIDPRFLPHVFEAFRQADGTASREHGGLGLGLAIARQLVELHGGTIEARAAEGGGALFEVFLPSMVAAAAVRAAPPLDWPDAPTLDAGLLRGVHVLVVDDEPDARLLLQTALGQYGADVTTAASAAEALAAIDAAVPDVLLSDIGMPHEDGFALLRRLRARPAAQGGALPAIAVTAYAAQHDRAAAEAAGYNAHVAKPYEPSQIATLVARLARHRPLPVHGSR